MRCMCCGEEVGEKTVCPICGSAVKSASSAGSVTDFRRARGNSAWATFGRKPEEQPAQPAQPAQEQQGGILQQIAEEKVKLVDECAKAICKVLLRCKNKTVVWGTGWCGYGDYIVTNAHVVEEMQKGNGKELACEFTNRLDLKEEQIIQADIIYYDRTEDIAVLLPRGGKLPKGVKVLRIEAKPTRQGELVFTIGNPLHYKFTYTEGVVANPNYIKQGRKFSVLQTTLTLNRGNSGGPVMNTNGDIVGMATFAELDTEQSQALLIIEDKEQLLVNEIKDKEIPGYGFCVRSEVILAAIKEIESKRR